MIREAQETYQYYTKQELGVELPLSHMHVVFKGTTVGEIVLRWEKFRIELRPKTRGYKYEDRQIKNTNQRL